MWHDRLEKVLVPKPREWVIGRISPESVEKDRLSLRNFEHDLLPILLRYIPRKKKVLEGGCGKGKYLFFLQREGYDVVGIENHYLLVKELKQVAPEYPVHCTDAFHLAYRYRSFGAYLSLGVIGHYEKYPDAQLQILSEAYRVLELGGVIIITVPILTPLYKLYKLYRNFLFWRVRHLKSMDWVRRFFGKKVARRHFDCYYFARKQFKDLLPRANFEIIMEKPLWYLAGITMWGGEQYFRASTEIQIEKQVTTLGKVLNQVNKIYPWFSPQVSVLVGRKL